MSAAGDQETRNMEPNRLLTIGVLSERTNVNIETIRYYERIGILPKPLRSEGGHRLYTDEYLQHLLFVRRARELGFSLDEVRLLLRLARRRSACAEVKSITERHIADIRQNIKGTETSGARVERHGHAMSGRRDLGLPNP